MSNGTNSIDGGEGDDSISADGGANSLRAGIGDDVITVLGGRNFVSGGGGDDTITLSFGAGEIDVPHLEGGGGTDILNIISSGEVVVPTATGFEKFFILDTVHQSIDFSLYTSLNSIELDSGTTINGATINTTLGIGQSLTLDSITDGDTAAASLGDGGIRIIQDSSITKLNLTLDDIGPNNAMTNQTYFWT